MWFHCGLSDRENHLVLPRQFYAHTWRTWPRVFLDKEYSLLINNSLSQLGHALSHSLTHSVLLYLHNDNFVTNESTWNHPLIHNLMHIIILIVCFTQTSLAFLTMQTKKRVSKLEILYRPHNWKPHTNPLIWFLSHSITQSTALSHARSVHFSFIDETFFSFYWSWVQKRCNQNFMFVIKTKSSTMKRDENETRNG